MDWLQNWFQNWWHDWSCAIESCVYHPALSGRCQDPIVGVGGDWKANSEVNVGSHDQHGTVTAGTVNFGHIDINQKGVTSYVAGTINVNQLPSSGKSAQSIQGGGEVGAGGRRIVAQHVNHGCMYINQESCTINVADTINLQTSPNPVEPVDQMLKKINKQMWNNVNVKIEIFQTENLTEPQYEFYPQIAESPDFYKGEHIVETKSTSTANSSRSEYVKDEMFQYQSRCETQSLSFESVMMEFSKTSQQGSSNRLSVIGLFAQAGAGKTTYMQNWAKRTMLQNGISPEEDYLSTANARFQLLLYYDLKDLKFQDASDTTVQELFFGDMLDDTRQLYDWLMENQNKVVIFFDGLDQASWEIAKEHATKIGPKQKTNIPTILYNIFSGILFPESRIVISSREFKASLLPYKARPQKVYTLTGFSSEDAESLFNTLVSQNHEKDDEDSQENPYVKFSKNLSFQHFLTIPMFLTFGALVYKFFNGFLPNSVTALFAKVLELIQDSNNSQQENIFEIISRLKELAHEGMKKGAVVFTNKDLEKHELTIEDARDLLLMVPKPKPLSQKLFKGDFTLFFCHQIIQEFLSACFVIELQLDCFLQFVEEHLHGERWSVVRRFVCGLLFCESINENLVQIEDRDEKRRILCKSLICQISKNDENEYQDLELFASIYESDDDQLIRSIMKMNLGVHVDVTRDAAHMISSLMSRTGELRFLQLRQLDHELLHVMATNLKDIKDNLVVGTIHLIHCRFGATDFNNFFQNIDSCEINMYCGKIESDSKQKERINWKNIQCLKIHTDPDIFLSTTIIFRNCAEFVSVSVYEEDDDDSEFQIVSGICDKKDDSLVFDDEVSERCDIILFQGQAAYYASTWLQPKSISINITGAPVQYLHYEYISKMDKWDSHLKIDEIILDKIDMMVEDKENLQPVRDKITLLVKLFQVKILNIAIPLEFIRCLPVQLECDLSAIGCELKIHVYEFVGEVSRIKELIPRLRDSQVQYFRLIYQFDSDKVEADVEDLMSFIRCCNVTKQLMIICDSSNVEFSDADILKLKDAAESSQLDLESEDSDTEKLEDAMMLEDSHSEDEDAANSSQLDLNFKDSDIEKHEDAAESSQLDVKLKDSNIHELEDASHFELKFKVSDIQKLEDAAKSSQVNLKFEEWAFLDMEDPWSFVFSYSHTRNVNEQDLLEDVRE